MVRVLTRLAVLAAAVGVLAACSASSSAGAASSAAPRRASTSASSPAPVAYTTAATATGCPLAPKGQVRNTMGMRLGRLTVLRSAGRTVGCRFYAIQNSALQSSEHLPGPNQPVVEITTSQYPTEVAAYNAFVLAAQAGRNPTRTALGRKLVGVCYQTDFYPKDHGHDWGCGVSVGRTRVLVRSVDTTGAFSTASVTRAVVARV
jgi:hypothetical protein